MQNETHNKQKSKSVVERIRTFLLEQLWIIEPNNLGRFARFGLKLLRLSVLVARESLTDALTVRAHALTAVTVLSLVPLFAVMFVIARASGLWLHLKSSFILPWLSELGEMRKVAETIISYVEKTDFKSLGTVGLLILFFTAINMLSQIERAFNALWRVKRGRSVVRKITDYTAIIVFTPLLLVLAGYLQVRSSALMYSVLPDWILHGASAALSKVLSYFLFWTGFTFLFLVMPNRKIPFLPALGAGILTGTLYRVSLFLFVASQLGVARYNALYSGLAALPLTVVWIDFSWLIILFGCEFAYALAHFNTYSEAFLRMHRRVSRKSREMLALRLLAEVLLRFRARKRLPSTEELAEAWGLPADIIEETIAELTEAKLLIRAEDNSTLAPALPLETLSIAEVRSKLANLGEPITPKDDALWQSIEVALSRTREGATLADVLSNSQNSTN